jgi:hypothetical protein
MCALSSFDVSIPEQAYTFQFDTETTGQVLDCLFNPGDKLI